MPCSSYRLVDVTAHDGRADMECVADGAVRLKRPQNVIVHTDRGSQYCSADYQALLKRRDLRGSKSARITAMTMPAAVSARSSSKTSP